MHVRENILKTVMLKNDKLSNGNATLHLATPEIRQARNSSINPRTSLCEKFEVPSSLRSDAIVVTTDGRTNRHSSNVLDFRADQMFAKESRVSDQYFYALQTY